MTKGQIWLLKKQDASASWEKAVRNVEKLANELEAQMASLRNSENLLEKIRQQHVAATELVNTAQAQYYEANAAVSNLENQVKNTADARERMQLQLQQLQLQLEKNASQQNLVEAEAKLASDQLQNANHDFSSTSDLAEAAKAALAASTQQHQAALANFNTSQATWLNAEQRVRLEQANIGHLVRSIGDANEQLKRLQLNLSTLQVPDADALIQKQQALHSIEAKLKTTETHISQAQANEATIQGAIKSAREHAHELQKNQHLLQAEIASLSKIQQSLHDANNESGLAEWLKKSGLNNKPRIWQGLSIQSGWETALEAVLGSRLNAVTHEQAPLASRPPTALSVAYTSADYTPEAKDGSAQSYTPLLALIERTAPGYAAVLNNWLKDVYVLTEDMDVSAQHTLRDGECLVNKLGDIYTKHSVVYFGAQSMLHGVLERQARLEQLQHGLPAIELALKQAHDELGQLEGQLQTLRSGQQTQQQQLKLLTNEAHAVNLSLQQLKQQQASAMQRKTMLETDIEIATQKLHQLHAEKSIKESAVADLVAGLEQMQADKAANEFKKQASETLLNEEKNSLKVRIDEVETTLNATKMEALKANLEASLNLKQQRETALVSARNTLNAEQETLMQQERQRMQNEQMLHPLRDKLEAARLNEQEARLHFEQCQTELAAFSMDEATLADKLNQMGAGHFKISQLEEKKTKLESDIEALGAVNLAAIEELTTEQARRQYLDSQCQDLTEASQTLEDAIRKIDRETRSRLQATFDQANIHFNELFTTLFGGGQARLVLLGDEILDTGIQVFAQPPGKKNSTIHLLSGGEKALTALALVFALFRLNPAPFCLMDEVDAPLDDSNTERFCAMVKKMSERTQFLYVSHNKITMEMAQQLIGVTMQESGVSRIVDVDMEAAVKMAEA
jgi:chromosome segregation protein